jgi:hypothetical protein
MSKNTQNPNQDPTTSPPSSVHTVETSATVPEILPYAAYRRTASGEEWKYTLSLYQAIDRRDYKNRVESLVSCGKFAFFTRHKQTGIVRVATSKCGLRWCPSCASSKAAFISHEITDHFNKLRYPKFLTLTLKHSSDPLPTQIDNLYAAFRRLRHSKQFKRAVFGGIWFFQVKQSVKSQQWHPHLHCIITGRFIPHCLIKRLWLRATGDSTIVDIRIVKDPAKMASYVARYAARPSSLQGLSESDQTALFDAMHGRRICGTWGDCSIIKLNPPTKINHSEWENLGSWLTVHHYAQFDAGARDIIRAWRMHTPLDYYTSFAEIDLAIDRGAFYDDSSMSINPPPAETIALFE